MTSPENNRVILLHPPQRLDGHGSKEMQRKMATITPKHCAVWMIDMAQVDFVDSSGLVALVMALKMANQIGSELVICNLRPTVRLIFEITQLDRVFAIFESREAALSSLGHVLEKISFHTVELEAA